MSLTAPAASRPSTTTTSSVISDPSDVAVDEAGLVGLDRGVLARGARDAQRLAVVEPGLGHAVVHRLVAPVAGSERRVLHVAAQAGQPAHQVGVARAPVPIEVFDRDARLALEERDRP